MPEDTNDIERLPTKTPIKPEITPHDIVHRLGGNFHDSLTAAAGLIGNIQRGLGEDPAARMATLSEEDLLLVRAALEEISDNTRRATAVVDIFADTRQAIGLTPEKARNGFAGNVHLSDIRIKVLLTIDPNTGEIKGIDRDTSKKCGRDQIITDIDGGEFVREVLILKGQWDNPDQLRSIDTILDAQLKRHGTVTDDQGRTMGVGSITPGQIPSSRAWANPNGKLRAKHEPTRAKAAARRKAMLSHVS